MSLCFPELLSGNDDSVAFSTILNTQTALQVLHLVHSFSSIIICGILIGYGYWKYEDKSKKIKEMSVKRRE